MPPAPDLPRCRLCRGELALRELPPALGADGAVRLELYGLRGFACAAPDHPREPPRSDFAADLVAAIGSGPASPFAPLRGLLRRRAVCGRCGAGLEGAAEPRELRRRIRIERAAPLTLTIQAPALTCASCRHDQLAPDPATRAQVECALLRALAAAGLA